MITRTRTAAAALTLTALALTACGGNNTDTSAPTSAPAPASASTPASSATTSPTPSLEPTYDNPDPDQPTGEALEAETPPPGDDTDAQPAPFSSATDPAGQIMANSDAAAGKDITLHVHTSSPGTASWTGMVNNDEGTEPVNGDWSKELPGAGAGLYWVNAQTETFEGTVTCELLVDGVVRDTDTGDGQATCVQPAEADN